jgi:uncharacterized OB-fold protein
MSDTKAASEANPMLPVVDYMQLPARGEPYLQGQQCRECGAVFIDTRLHCAKCAARNSMQPCRLSNTGKLFAFTVVQRSYPGIPVPFVSAIVDLDGGGTVKGNLINVDPDPAKIDLSKIRVGMPVELVYKQAPWDDEKGNQYLMFYFQPKQ